MKQLEISILVPVFNTAEYLRECLDSVVGQTFKDFEVICVNDGSTDSSLSILSEYAHRDDRIKIINKAENQGLLMARKTAVLQAQGKYIVFLDSDDYLSRKDSLQIMLSAIEKEKTDILQFSVEFGTHRIIHAIDKKLDSIDKYLITGSIEPINHWNQMSFWYVWPKIYRRDVCLKAYEAIEDRYIVMWEDVYATFMISYLAHSCAMVNTVPLITYRQGTGISTKNQITLDEYNLYCQVFGILDSLKKFLRQQQKFQQFEKIYDALYERIRSWCFDDLRRLHVQDLPEALQMLSRCSDVSPMFARFSSGKLLKYSVLSRITFGKMQKRYLEKAKIQAFLKSAQSFIKMLNEK